jgi:hypothetical protein
MRQIHRPIDGSSRRPALVNRQRHLVNPVSGGVRKVDVVLVALGVVAAVATTVAIAKSDDWTGERTYTFSSSSDTVLPDQGPIPAGSAPARFEWVVPDNATGILATIAVNYQAQAVQGGQAIVRISGTAPDGSSLPVVTWTLPVSGTSGTQAQAYNASWQETPRDVRDTRQPDGMHWEGPLVVLVTVERPADVPLASYSFTAQAGGRFVTAVLD